jgi:hypothetical protein
MFHHERHLIQFTPARAKKKLTVDELNLAPSGSYDEQKIDGERYTIQTECGGSYRHGITSRRQSEVTGRMVEKTDRVPHISNNASLPPQSMFDTEFVSSGDMILRELPGKFWDKLMEPNHKHLKWLKNKFGGSLPIYPHVGKTVSIMGSLATEAIRKQEEIGQIWAYTFDITRYQARDLQANTQIARRKFLAGLLENVDPESGIILMPAWANLTLKERIEFFYLITDPFRDIGEDGGEGLILKDPQQKYNGPRNWYKVKRDWPADVVYTGVSKEGEEGKTGQMLGMAASLEIGVYHHGILCPIGWVSGIRDGMAGLQTPQQHMANAGQPIEVRHNGLQEKADAPLGYTLRHPRFRRDRKNDKNGFDCTWDALYEEASKKVD